MTLSTYAALYKLCKRMSLQREKLISITKRRGVRASYLKRLLTANKINHTSPVTHGQAFSKILEDFVSEFGTSENINCDSSDDGFENRYRAVSDIFCRIFVVK